MKKILIIQFRTNTRTLEEERIAFGKVLNKLSIEVIFKNAFSDIEDWANVSNILEGANGVILGGSGEFDFDGGREADDMKRQTSYDLVESMSPFLHFLEVNDFPTLAICFGHQILGKFSGVTIINDIKQAKVGSHQVCVTEEGKRDSLFHNLPEIFFAQYGHKDSLSMIPESAVLLARGEQCLYSALRLGTNRYSVQFHPELDAEDVIQKFISHPDYLPEGLTQEELIKESPYATKILANFIEKILL